MLCKPRHRQEQHRWARPILLRCTPLPQVEKPPHVYRKRTWASTKAQRWDRTAIPLEPRRGCSRHRPQGAPGAATRSSLEQLSSLSFPSALLTSWPELAQHHIARGLVLYIPRLLSHNIIPPLSFIISRGRLKNCDWNKPISNSGSAFACTTNAIFVHLKPKTKPLWSHRTEQK